MSPLDTTTGEIIPTRGRPHPLDVLRDQIAPNATDDELRWLAAVGQKLDLDPIAGHIVLIPRWDGRLERNVMRPQITADGRLVLADRTGELDGFTGPEWTGPRNDDGSHTWVEVWDGDKDHPPHAARAFVYRKGRTHPTNGTVRWQEFAQRNKAGKLLPTWTQMPSHMLGKVALSLAVRRAFPGILVGEDVADDFVPFEREDDGYPAQGSDPAPRRRPETVPPVPPGPSSRLLAEGDPLVEALTERLNNEPEMVRIEFKDWRRSKGYDYPPATTDIATAMEQEVDRLEAELGLEEDTYEQ